MKKECVKLGIAVLMLIVAVSLAANLVVAQACINNSVCPPVYGNKYCSENRSCQSVGSYQCINNTCVSAGGGVGCTDCPHGCLNGACKNRTIACSSNSDCGTSTTNRYCSNNSAACSSSLSYICNNPGTTSSFCAGAGMGGCSAPCPYGCSNGACINRTQNQTIVCYSNSDCGTSTTTRYCSNNSAACSSSLSYICNNPGTPSSFCVGGGAGGCSAPCPKGCLNGACINQTNQTIVCYSNSDCGTSTTTRYCSNNSEACSSSVFYICNNPGTPSSLCAGAGMGGCSAPCPYGCSDGACIKAPTCSDSDGGRNYVLKGTCASGMSNISYTDFCKTTRYLKEYACSGNICSSSDYLCSKSCSNGACTNQNQTIVSLRESRPGFLSSIVEWFKNLFS